MHTEQLYALHPATEADMDDLVELIRAADHEAIGQSNFDRSEIEYIYHSPRFDPARDICIARDSLSGQAVGYGLVFATRAVPVRPWGWGWTRPDARGKGIGSAIVQWMIDRARQCEAQVPPQARVVLEVGTPDRLTDSIQLLENLGFTTDRSAYAMLIDLDSEPEVPALPDGLRFITFAEKPDVELFARARKQGFADHRGAVDEPIEAVIERVKHEVEDSHFVPELWMMAMDGDQPAGIAYNATKNDEYADTGWVDSLAVMPAYRKQGLGYTLLKKSFAEFYARGFRKVGLGVDGSSLTGAVRLYERAGMHIARRTRIYELEIRPGVELSKQ